MSAGDAHGGNSGSRIRSTSTTGHLIMTAIRHYRRDAAQAHQNPALVYPYVMRTARSSAEMAAVHALLTTAYTARGKRMAPRGAWWEALLADPGFDPSLVLLVVTPNGILAAAAMASNTGRVTELVVAPSFRRLGLGTALLGHLGRLLKERGVAAVDLQVEADNHAAVALCEALNMARSNRLPELQG
jgi:ribosomal protein S18 acetylase RimI-like enzyme